MAKKKEGVVLGKRNPVYKINITKNIFESSSVQEPEEKKIARQERDALRLKRRKKSAQQKLTVPSEVSKKYDILALYHQLNYADIRNVLKYMQIKPAKIDNSYLLLKDLPESIAEEVKDALLECHFETKSKKQYKVRVVMYKSIQKPEQSYVKKKASNNNAVIAAEAKSKRKINKQKCFENRSIHKTGRKTNKISHKAGTIDTSNILRKITANARKACAYLEKKERQAKIQAEHLSKLRTKSNKKVTQTIINFDKS